MPAIHLEATFANASQRGHVCLAEAPRPKHGDDEGIRVYDSHVAGLLRLYRKRGRDERDDENDDEEDE